MSGNGDDSMNEGLELDNQEIHSFNETIKTHSAYDFTNYSEKSLKRRLSKILHDRKLSIPELNAKLRAEADYLEQTVKDLTVNTTEMFRDPPIWHLLRYDILPRFSDRNQLHIWHPGCSTGQEVYSMMILLNELGMLDRTTLYGTDINEDVLKVAGKGVYKYRFNVGYLDNFDSVIRENPRDNNLHYNVDYERYFHIDKTRDNINMSKTLVLKPHWKKMDLVTEGNPFEQTYDLILCRNVIIYFNYELQNKVFKLFLDNMQPQGCLILGVHETILGPMSIKFEKKFQAYFKK